MAAKICRESLESLAGKASELTSRSFTLSRPVSPVPC
jgi:hypothetical protein